MSIIILFYIFEQRGETSLDGLLSTGPTRSRFGLIYKGRGITRDIWNTLFPFKHSTKNELNGETIFQPEPFKAFLVV